MRFFKFRAWHKEDKKMFPNAELSFHSLGDPEIDYPGEYYDYHGFNQVLDDDDVVVMQYTGLLDKDNKEIYEGDIVQDIDGDIYLVKYIPPYFACYRQINEEHRVREFDLSVRVIGNIFENPDLIKGLYQ